MRDLLRALHKDGLAELLSCNVHQLLPRLVGQCFPFPSFWSLVISFGDFTLSVSFFFFSYDRNMRSESCPFCRGSIKRVDSGDLWVMTCNSDVVDQETVSKEDMLRFYMYMNSLPKDIPNALFLFYYEYLIWCEVSSWKWNADQCMSIESR